VGALNSKSSTVQVRIIDEVGPCDDPNRDQNSVLGANLMDRREEIAKANNTGYRAALWRFTIGR
jgi:hypothetical protein